MAFQEAVWSFTLAHIQILDVLPAPYLPTYLPTYLHSAHYTPGQAYSCQSQWAGLTLAFRAVEGVKEEGGCLSQL